MPDPAGTLASHLDVYVSASELRAEIGVPTGQDDRIDRALVMGQSYALSFCDGAVPPVLDPGPLVLTVVATTPGRRQGAMVASVRYWQSASVPFGVLGGLGDLATRVSGASIPEADLAMQYDKADYGVA